LETSQPPRRIASQILALALVVSLIGGRSAAADQPAGAPSPTPASAASDAEPNSLPQDSFFSSIKQSLRQGDSEVVRGYFDLGSPPNGRRYYCLVDPKTHRREPNGVLGDPVARPDGMTGIKSNAVSLYSCAEAEKRGMLVTAGYVSPASPAAAAAAPVPPPVSQAAQTPPAAPAPQPQVPVSAAATASAAPSASAAPVLAAPTRRDVSADQVDVSGVRLGMSPDEVRAVLKSKRLLASKEWTETLSYLDAAKGTIQPIAQGRFVNVMAAWTAPQPPAAADNFATDGESYEVMFTPVPGKERVMAIVHTVGYSPANAIHESALENGLVRKYGGFAAGNELPDLPTWRFQGSGGVQVGDSCGRRGVFGGLGGLDASNAGRGNLALKQTPAEFRSQIDRCGIAIVTEDHFTANGGALREDRLVTRFTVTAYSPSLGYEGANTAMQLIQASGHSINKAEAPRAKEERPPDL
jgi:hypothetical protein